MNTIIIAGSSNTLEAAILSGLRERMSAKVGTASEAEMNRKALFAELDQLKEDLILAELEDQSLAALAAMKQAVKKPLLAAMASVNAQISAEKDQAKARAMRGAKGRVEGQINAVTAELSLIFKERGEVLATIKQLRVSRSELKKKLNASLAPQPMELASPERVSQLAVTFNKGLEQMVAAA
jgi:16S rRNA C1402 (ribose-2'-O) methylase RsmI